MQDNNFKLFLKNFLLMGIPFGVIMGLFYVFQEGLQLGIIQGVLSGILFGALTSIFRLRQYKKASENVPGYLNPRHITYQGGASHSKGIIQIGGWLFLTSNFLLFKTHRQNYEIKVDIKEIKAVTKGRTLGIVPNRIVIETSDGKIKKFIVHNRSEWEEKILEQL